MINFSEQLKQIRNGDLDAEVTEALAECVRAVYEGGGTASVTLKITMKRAAGNRGYITVIDDVTKKLPKKPANESILFAQPDGTLWEDNPKQERIFEPVKRIARDIATCDLQVSPAQPVNLVDTGYGVVTINPKSAN